MFKIKPLIFIAIFSLVAIGCKEKSSKKDSSSNTNSEKAEAKTSNSFHGIFTLTDMKTVKGDLEPTEQDLAYIKQSKERTIGKTELTLNEDGTFKRVFPHPSGDGSTRTWNGKYEIMDDKMVFNVEMNGKTNPMEFDILKKSSDELSIVADFGKLRMNYVYSK